jgi:asparagine N-glycosylation enzyme membrane subunit Stt3
MSGRSKMNKRTIMIIAIVIAAVVVVAAVSYVTLTKTGKELPTSIEYVGGKYNVTLSFYEELTGYGAQIDYVDETGNHSEHYFEPQMRTGLDWIRNNTSENTIFLCWWDYGHMIKGYAERNVIVRNPSHEWINMVAIARTDPSAIKEFDPNEKLVDVAKALATSNSSETSQIMEKYGATYIVVYKDDSPSVGKAYWIYIVAGLDPTVYITSQNSTSTFSSAGMGTMIAKLLDNRDTGFTLVYQDAVMKVYKKD